MRTALIITIIFVIILGAVAFMQYRTIKKLSAGTAAKAGRDEVSAGEWTQRLSEQLKSMDIKLEF